MLINSNQYQPSMNIGFWYWSIEINKEKKAWLWINDFPIEFDDDFMSHVIDYYRFLSIVFNFVNR